VPVPAPPPEPEESPAEPPSSAPATTDDHPAYDAEHAPVKFTLTEAHRVLLDEVTPLPGASGTVSGLKLLMSRQPTGQFKLVGTRLSVDVPDLNDAAPPGKVPPLLFMPGKKPGLEVALGKARWTRAGARVAVLTASSSESPGEGLQLTANGEPFTPAGASVIVDANDRFTIRDLGSRMGWKVSVAARASEAGKTVPPVLLVAQGVTVRLDGKELPSGYGVLTAGKHRLTGAVSAWLTVPALKSEELATLDVSFDQ
jgi:hypothetical protein